MSHRERRVIEIVYNLGKATVAKVLRSLPDRVSGGTIRTCLRRLEGKELLRRCKMGREFVYHPIQSRACNAESISHTEARGAKDETMFYYAAIHADHSLTHTRQNSLAVGML